MPCKSLWHAGSCHGKAVKIRKMAAHGGLAFGKDSGQKLHIMQQKANKRQKTQHKSGKKLGKRKAMDKTKTPSSA